MVEALLPSVINNNSTGYTLRLHISCFSDHARLKDVNISTLGALDTVWNAELPIR